MTTKMQSCVDHIKTSLDVDPWAAEMVEKIFTEYDRRFDKVLEIIDTQLEALADGKYGGASALNYVYESVLKLKGGEHG